MCIAVKGDYFEGGGGGGGLSSFPMCVCSYRLIPGVLLFDFVVSVFIDLFLTLCAVFINIEQGSPVFWCFRERGGRGWFLGRF